MPRRLERATHELPPPRARTASHDASEDPREMRLIAHSAIECDLRQRFGRAHHELLGPVHALMRNIGERRNAEALFEGAKEVAGAELNDLGEFLDAYARGKIGLDVRGDAFGLPRCQAAAGCRRTDGPDAVVTQSRPQQFCRLLDASPCCSDIAFDGCLCVSEKFHEALR